MIKQLVALVKFVLLTILVGYSILGVFTLGKGGNIGVLVIIACYTCLAVPKLMVLTAPFPPRKRVCRKLRKGVK
jgi:hypothetical protein